MNDESQAMWQEIDAAYFRAAITVHMVKHDTTNKSVITGMLRDAQTVLHFSQIYIPGPGS